MGEWNWTTIEVCDCQELTGILNKRMGALSNYLQGGRPRMLAGYPEHVGVVTDNATVTAPVDTAENTLKTFTFDRGVIGSKGGFVLRASGTSSGAAGNLTLKLYFGGVVIETHGPVGCNGDWQMEAWFWNANDDQVQQVTVFTWFNGALVTADTTVSYVDFG